jgi:hypothetical protein
MLCVVAAVLLIHVSSREATWGGFIDRTINVVLAYYALCLAFPKPPNAEAHGRDERSIP